MTIRSLDPLTCFGLLSTDDLLWEEFCHQEFVDAVHERGDGDGEEEGQQYNQKVSNWNRYMKFGQHDLNVM